MREAKKRSMRCTDSKMSEQVGMFRSNWTCETCGYSGLVKFSPKQIKPGTVRTMECVRCTNREEA